MGSSASMAKYLEGKFVVLMLGEANVPQGKGLRIAHLCMDHFKRLRWSSHYPVNVSIVEDGMTHFLSVPNYLFDELKKAAASGLPFCVLSVNPSKGYRNISLQLPGAPAPAESQQEESAHA